MNTAEEILESKAKEIYGKGWQKALTAFRIMAESEPLISKIVLAAMKEYASQSVATPEAEIRSFLRENRIIRRETQDNLFEVIKLWEGYKAAIKKDEPDLVASVPSNDETSLASHTCTEGGSIQQGSRKLSSMTEQELADFIYEQGYCGSPEYWQKPSIGFTYYDEGSGTRFFSYTQKQKPEVGINVITTDGLIELGDDPKIFTHKYNTRWFHLKDIVRLMKMGFSIPLLNTNHQQ